VKLTNAVNIEFFGAELLRGSITLMKDSTEFDTL